MKKITPLPNYLRGWPCCPASQPHVLCWQIHEAHSWNPPQRVDGLWSFLTCPKPRPRSRSICFSMAFPPNLQFDMYVNSIVRPTLFDGNEV